MRELVLVCTSVSQDRLVAYFAEEKTKREVFAYLPHVPGLNPWVLRVGDRIAGHVAKRNSRLELAQATRQADRRGAGSAK